LHVSVGTNADVDVDDDEEEEEEEDDSGTVVDKNAPVRSKSRMVPSVKPAITRRPEDVAVIDVHSSLMGNEDVRRTAGNTACSGSNGGEDDNKGIL
jgi:hypothetical protein